MPTAAFVSSFGPSISPRAFRLPLSVRHFSKLQRIRSFPQCSFYGAIDQRSNTDLLPATISVQPISTESLSSPQRLRHIRASSTATFQFSSLPYYVHRTASRELPIYHVTKRGGNLHQTRIRKINGDRAKLLAELRLALRVKPENIRVNQVTGNIIIKVYKASANPSLSMRC